MSGFSLSKILGVPIIEAPTIGYPNENDSHYLSGYPSFRIRSKLTFESIGAIVVTSCDDSLTLALMRSCSLAYGDYLNAGINAQATEVIL